MKKALIWLGAYILCVVSFMFIYMTYWNKNPDSFIINTQVNVNPFKDINDFIWMEGKTYNNNQSFDLTSLKDKYKSDIKKIEGYKKQIDNINLRFKQLNEESKKLSTIRNNEVENKFKIYDIKTLTPYKNKEIKLEEELKILEEKLPRNVRTDYDLALVKTIGDKRVELANARVETASQAVHNSNYLLENVTAFFSEKTDSEYMKIYHEEKKLYENLLKAENETKKIREQVINSLENDIAALREKIHWVDFLFFSIGISTTTTFGDLIANDIVTKSLVSFQLLLCIFITAVFLSLAIGSKK